MDDYTQEDGWLVLYRHVSEAEWSSIGACGGFAAQTGGMESGKHFTNTAEHARTWARMFVEADWEAQQGRILRVRVRAEHADEIHFDPMADGIGPQCFVPFGGLSTAKIEEVT